MGETVSLKKATIINAAAKYSNVIFQLIATAILARILSPEDYGIVAVVTVFSTFFKLFADMGFSAGVIQNKELTENDVNHIFSCTVYIGIALMITFCLISFPISWFYNNPIYIRLGAILALSLLFQSMNMIPNAVLMREKRFILVAVRTVGVGIVTYALTIVMAMMGFSYYALVWQAVFSSAITFFWNQHTVRLRFYVRPNTDGLKKIWGFSSFNMAFNVTNYLARNLDNLLCGKVMGEAELGYYNKAYNLMLYPVQYLTNVITPVLHPIFSDYQNNKKIILKKYRSVLKILSLLGVFISVYCFFCSEEIVVILYGENWANTIPCMRLLAISIWFQMTSSSCGSIYQSIGCTKLMFKSALVFVPIQIACIAIGVFSRNINTLSFFVSASFIIKFIVDYFFLIAKGFAESFVSWLCSFLPEICITGICVGAMCLAGFLNIENVYISALCNAVVCVAAFVLGLFITKQHKYLLPLVHK